ncbi:MAG: hypothetical protein ACNYPG_05710 [Candidatus Porifericomitaceae bacterium WSBS_2022_MAG_OTU9]
MKRLARLDSLFADFPTSALAPLLAARHRGRGIMPKIAALMPAGEADNCLDCLFFQDRLILVVSTGAWCYYLRLRQKAIMAVLRQHGGSSQRLLIRALPQDINQERPKLAMPSPSNEVIAGMQIVAGSLHSQGLKDALLRLCHTLEQRKLCP